MVARKSAKEQGGDKITCERPYFDPTAIGCSWGLPDMKALFAAAALLALAGCNKPAAAPPAATAPAAPTATPTAGAVNPVVTITSYACADTGAAPVAGAPPAGETLEVGYPDPASAVLVWRGHAYTLKLAQGGNGVRYIGYGMQWWTKTPTHGALSVLKTGEELASDAGLDCVAGAPPPATTALTTGSDGLPGVVPPAPGAPGGLPADKTPLSEAPFTPTSAQGAANVVQTYYAFLEKRSSADAAKLRADGAAENLSAYSEYHAEIGAPGAIQGGAGSVVVEVPVVVYGRLAGGAEFHRSGKAVLRRINDVPGSTPLQREWHIERIELKDFKPSPPAKPRAAAKAPAPAPAPH